MSNEAMNKRRRQQKEDLKHWEMCVDVLHNPHLHSVDRVDRTRELMYPDTEVAKLDRQAEKLAE